jgi:hypothetical protein
MFRLPLSLSAFLAASVTVFAATPPASSLAFDPASSPFADHLADSYANYVGEDGLTVRPRWGDAPLTDFGSVPVAIAPLPGMRDIAQVPAPGVHPRLLVTPESLPDLRLRLRQTRAGQRAWNNILAWTEMMKGRYESTAPYAQPDLWRGSFGGLRGPVPLFRLGLPRGNGVAYDRHPGAAAAWQALIDGSATEFPPFYWHVMALEAFRCLIEDDAEAGRQLAAATTTALRLDQAKRDADRAARQAKNPAATLPPPSQPVGEFQLAFIYDYAHAFLSPEQRAALHAELAATTWSHDNYGTFNAAHGSRSNWATFSYWLFQTLAIEDEPGFNEIKVRGMYRGWRNLFTYGWFPSGATFEGEAKNQLGLDGLFLFAQRRDRYGFEPLAAHPHALAYATRFLPHSVNPARDGFIKYDLLGGSRNQGSGFTSIEAAGLKYLYPDDPAIDWVYRLSIGENYENVPDRPDGYYNALLTFAVFATDFDPANDDPSRLGLGNTFFCGERALLMTRSDWSTDAVQLNLHVRQANGGHPYADRNSILLNGAGRVWSPVQGARAFENHKASLVVIDQKPQSVHSPGRMVAFADSEAATFATGDAKYAWDWNWANQDPRRGLYTPEDVRAGRVTLRPGWELEPNSTNSFAYTKRPFPYLHTPRSETPHWVLPAGAVRPVARQANHPVLRAYRTAGLVRGPRPYALVFDDIRKDDETRLYEWILTLEPDLQIVGIHRSDTRSLDILLTGDDPAQANPAPKEPLPPRRASGLPVPPGQPTLLVRVLHADGLGEPFIDVTPAKGQVGPVRRLVIPARSVDPRFRVLLYPHRQGAPLPSTPFLAEGSGFEVRFPGESSADQLRFTPHPSGLSRFTLLRDGKTALDFAPEPPPPLP